MNLGRSLGVSPFVTILRQENAASKVDVIILTHGQAYDLMDALSSGEQMNSILLYIAWAAFWSGVARLRIRPTED
jgi:hypothetical protein